MVLLASKCPMEKEKIGRHYCFVALKARYSSSATSLFVSNTKVLSNLENVLNQTCTCKRTRTCTFTSRKIKKVKKLNFEFDSIGIGL